MSNNDQLVLIIKELASSLTDKDTSFIITDDPRDYVMHMSKDVREKN